MAMQGVPRPNRFPKAMRLRGPDGFRHVFDAASRSTGAASPGAVAGPKNPGVTAGRVSSGPLQALFAVRSGDPARPGPMRLGLAVPRRLGTAVVRNRLRRQLRESFRTLGELHTPGVDVVIVVRSNAGLETPVVRQHVRRVLERLAGQLSPRAGEGGGGQPVPRSHPPQRNASPHRP
ncbi:MAG: ribonuclease P protein component [Tepidisphaerales bacterium]